MKANKKLSKIKGAQFYKVGDKVETIKTDIGAWFSADIIDIAPNSKCECQWECHCVYKLLFEGNDNEVQVVERTLNEIRQVSYSSIDWDKLEVGMKVVINYNIDKPKQWGHWYDYVIEDIQKRDNVFYASGTLLVGLEGCSNKIPVKIDSDNVADVLEIRPHISLEEKESDSYETGVKPEYCKKCRNKPKVRCKKCCCCKCGSKKDFQLTVQCDECADWYHIYCIHPPLNQLPNDEDWYCPKCNNQTRRAKMELKQKLKKQSRSKQQSRKIKGKSVASKSVKPSPPTGGATLHTNVQTDIVSQELTKNIPKESAVWKEVEKMFVNYDILHVIAKVAKKKDAIIDAELEHYINQDVVNKHLWDEAKEELSNGKEEFIKAVKRIFTCSICFEIMNDPITLSCKHSFCIDCFLRSLSVNVYNCVLCRVDVIHTQHYSVNENLRNALNLLFEIKD